MFDEGKKKKERGRKKKRTRVVGEFYDANGIPRARFTFILRLCVRRESTITTGELVKLRAPRKSDPH